MRIFFSILLCITSLAFLTPLSVLAQDTTPTPTTVPPPPTFEITDPVLTEVKPCDGPSAPAFCLDTEISGLVAIGVQSLFVIAVIISLIFILIGGIKWITSGGDKNALAGARSTLIAAIIGLIVVFLAYFIVNLVLQLFTGSNITDIKFSPLVPETSTNVTP